MVKSGRIQGMSLSQKGSSRDLDTKSQVAEAVSRERLGRGQAQCGGLCEETRLCISWVGQALCFLTHAVGGSGKRKEKVSGWRGPGGHAGALAALLKMAGLVTGL